MLSACKLRTEIHAALDSLAVCAEPLSRKMRVATNGQVVRSDNCHLQTY